MEIVCPNCGQICETEDELVIGQHVLCPFCNVKFTYGTSVSTTESQSAENQMDVKCPGCGTEYEVESGEIGQEAECEVCGRKFVIGAKENDAIQNSANRTAPRSFSFSNDPSGKTESAEKATSETSKAMNAVDYVGNRLYFSDDNTEHGKNEAWANNCTIGCMLVVGVIIGCICCGTGSAGLGIVIIIACVITGLFCSLKEKSHFKSDKEIDAQASGMGKGLEDKALDKLGIDPEEVSMVKPLKFWGYRFVDPCVLGDAVDANACWISGKDGKLRSSEVSHTIFYFGEHSVYCYVRTTSLVNGGVSNERTEEYFYKDIVSVKTDTIETRRTKANKSGKTKSKMSKVELELLALEALAGSVKNTRNVFVLVNTGGERLVCEVENQTEADAAVRAFRTLLKQKKF